MLEGAPRVRYVLYVLEGEPAVRVQQGCAVIILGHSCARSTPRSIAPASIAPAASSARCLALFVDQRLVPVPDKRSSDGLNACVERLEGDTRALEWLGVLLGLITSCGSVDGGGVTIPSLITV